MIDYVRYLSGHWQTTCRDCGAQAIFEQVWPAFEHGRGHRCRP